MYPKKQKTNCLLSNTVKLTQVYLSIFSIYLALLNVCLTLLSLSAVALQSLQKFHPSPDSDPVGLWGATSELHKPITVILNSIYIYINYINTIQRIYIYIHTPQIYITCMSTTHTYVYVNVNVYVHVNVYVDVYVYLDEYVYVDEYVSFTCIFIFFVCVGVCVCVYVYIFPHRPGEGC